MYNQDVREEQNLEFIFIPLHRSSSLDSFCSMHIQCCMREGIGHEMIQGAWPI